MKVKQKKGISLIVLVITIIVMIVLAAAIILSLSSSGVIGRANEAKTKSDVANAKQVVAMANAEWLFDEAKVQSDYGVETFKEYAESKLTEAGYKVGIDKDITVSEDGAINIVYIDKNEDIAIIPEGFEVSIVASEQTIENGLVIVDKNGNEFVWVPVDDIDEFVRRDGYHGGKLETHVSEESATEPFSKTTSDGITLSLTNDLTGEWEEEAAMRESVNENGGFYIARYEAGKEENNTVVSKKGATVWNDISWGISMTNIGTEGAVYRARQMYKNSNSVVSTLCYGVQWDSALQFISTRGIKDKEYLKYSMGKGYYAHDPYWNDINPEEVQKSGSNDKYSLNNIYDMAGNVWEWTMEALGVQSRVVRGGWYTGNGYQDPVSDRNYFTTTNDGNAFGFRVALYIK